MSPGTLTHPACTLFWSLAISKFPAGVREVLGGVLPATHSMSFPTLNPFKGQNKHKGDQKEIIICCLRVKSLCLFLDLKVTWLMGALKANFGSLFFVTSGNS